MPETVCWGVFKRSDVTSLLPSGGKVTLDEDLEFDMHGSTVRSSTCVLYVDGNNKFLASVSRHRSAETIDWSTWSKNDPDELRVGTKAIIWGKGDGLLAGAASYVTCGSEAPENARYLELDITAWAIPKADEARVTLEKQIEDFTEYASTELSCTPR
ncbi:hypothetical protein [Streptomyces sp. KLOTTS4A1]|uniref:hypothetical protein n=1 Tax=Streptomyces sp. KLOTTS4A1 TaxID=3390996 RepID=UPI0039F4D63D